jgi:septum formation protein
MSQPHDDQPRAHSLILGSSSPRRRELLSMFGIPFTILRPDIDETPRPGENAIDYVARLSREKSLAVPDAVPGDAQPALILTADSTVVLDGQIIGKPEDEAEAVVILRALRGRAHQVHTSVSLRDARTGEITTQVITTDVHMRPYTDLEIENSIASGVPFDKAGAYAVQDAVFRPVARFEGCLTNIIGLPVCAVCALLREKGMCAASPLDCSPTDQPCAYRL